SGRRRFCEPYEFGLPMLSRTISASGLRTYTGEREPLLGVVANSATVPARYKSIEWILHSRSCSNDWYRIAPSPQKTSGCPGKDANHSSGFSTSGGFSSIRVSDLPLVLIRR